ncbi:putative DNA repair protein rad9 [Triangularia verruculosa]|uniref:DNA repair protein rad9 n=1 Tax=Triangularia verruculosa TaxID=2587418 RepID=A0AAN6XH23_9PEZI|nr:putative DNA repair protein rad9 [Triangularia verruculosa]
MVVLNFTLSEDGVAVLHDALACMFKFSDEVCLEARKEKLTLTTLNISKSAYVCYSFAANRFFSRYKFEGSPQYREKFSCQLYIKSLLAIFRTRQGGGETAPGRDASIERCDVAIDDGVGKKSRLVARISFRNGITASHSLPYEVKAPTHAKFNEHDAGNHWAISSKTLRQLMDHFGPGIELLDINTDEESNLVNFTCFTEKVQKRGGVNSETVLKKPLHTNIAVEMDEFDNVQVEDKLHIIISVKDFRAILQHAQITSGELATRYSNPGRPMKLYYKADGIKCEFILMTVGEKDAKEQRHKTPRPNASVKGPRPELDAASHRASSLSTSARQQAPPEPTPRTVAQAPQQPQNPTPARPRHPPAFDLRPPQLPPPGTAQSEDSMFMGPAPEDEADEDHQWAPVNPDEDEEEEENARLEWNSTSDPNPSTLRISSYLQKSSTGTDNTPPDRQTSGLDPTQRLSQVRGFGLFAD